MHSKIFILKLLEASASVSVTLNQTFTNDLKDKSSTKYKTLWETLDKGVRESMQKHGNDDLKQFSGCSDFTFSKGSIIADFTMNFESRSKPQKQINRNDILDAFNKTMKDSSSALSQLNAEKVTISKIQSDGFSTQIFTTASPTLTTAWKKDTTIGKIEHTTK